MTETNEQLKAEIDAITTHVSDTDRRVRALETTVKRLAVGDDVATTETQPEHVTPAGQSGHDEEIADLRRTRDEARKLMVNWKRVVDERTNERDEARDEQDKLKMELEESKAAQVEPVTDKGVESLICQLEKDLAFVEQDSGQRTTSPDVYRATIATLRALAGDRKR